MIPTKSLKIKLENWTGVMHTQIKLGTEIRKITVSGQSR
jgi:hypothetical protein